MICLFSVILCKSNSRKKYNLAFFLFQAPLLVVLSCIVASLAMPYPMPYPFPDEPGYGQPAYSPPSYGSVGRVKIQVSLLC